MFGKSSGKACITAYRRRYTKNMWIVVHKAVRNALRMRLCNTLFQ
ncbi:hypothetical protein [Enterococcus phage vB_Efs19_KEN17]